MVIIQLFFKKKTKCSIFYLFILGLLYSLKYKNKKIKLIMLLSNLEDLSISNIFLDQIFKKFYKITMTLLVIIFYRLFGLWDIISFDGDIKVLKT